MSRPAKLPAPAMHSNQAPKAIFVEFEAFKVPKSGFCDVLVFTILCCEIVYTCKCIWINTCRFQAEACRTNAEPIQNQCRIYAQPMGNLIEKYWKVLKNIFGKLIMGENSHEGEPIWWIILMMENSHEVEFSWGRPLMRENSHEGESSWGRILVGENSHKRKFPWEKTLMSMNSHEEEFSWR